MKEREVRPMLEVVDLGEVEASDGEVRRMVLLFHRGRVVKTVPMERDADVWIVPRGKEEVRA
jgi:hypothetical protein